MTASIDVKCPQCGSNSFYLYERVEVAHLFEIEKGKAHPMQRSEGLPLQLGFSAECVCGHSWIPRRSTALRIMDAERSASCSLPGGA